MTKIKNSKILLTILGLFMAVVIALGLMPGGNINTFRAADDNLPEKIEDFDGVLNWASLINYPGAYTGDVSEDWAKSGTKSFKINILQDAWAGFDYDSRQIHLSIAKKYIKLTIKATTSMEDFQLYVHNGGKWIGSDMRNVSAGIGTYVFELSEEVDTIQQIEFRTLPQWISYYIDSIYAVPTYSAPVYEQTEEPGNNEQPGEPSDNPTETPSEQPSSNKLGFLDDIAAFLNNNTGASLTGIGALIVIIAAAVMIFKRK